MASKSPISYSARAELHPHPVAKRLLRIAEAKKSNLIVSADFGNTKQLLECADVLGPYIAVFKTHIDIVNGFDKATIVGLKALADKHNFLIFEDRKLVDIGSTVQKQYHNGALRISEWADIVNVSILGGEGVVEALGQIMTSDSIPYRHERALLLLAELTTSGSMAKGEYTDRCVQVAQKHADVVMGFVAIRSLGSESVDDQDFIIFTIGVNRSQKGDSLGQQYQSSEAAVKGGSDFLIVGRGIYASEDPVAAAKMYRREGWQAYEERIGKGSEYVGI